MKNILFMIDCTQYIIAQRQRGYPDQTFYNEYDFICHARFEKDPVCHETQTNSLQTTIFLHREDLK